MNTALAERAHYYSTACLHLKHAECRGTCKFCSRPCGCECHKQPAPAGRPTEDSTMSSTYDPNAEPDQPTPGDVDPDETDEERRQREQREKREGTQSEPRRAGY